MGSNLDRESIDIVLLTIVVSFFGAVPNAYCSFILFVAVVIVVPTLSSWEQW